MYNSGKPRTMLGRPSPVSKGVNNPPGRTGMLPAQAQGRAVGLVDRMRAAVPAGTPAQGAGVMPARAVQPSMGQPVQPMGFMDALRRRKTI